ncbi:MAG: NAD(P)-binding domain-containing protein [Actinomycetota bacterium]|nr:NAD(P)-binding domain-containing protein [Actinomycetota bacterium]
MRVLFADAIDPSSLEALMERGHECVSDPKLSADDLAGRIPGFEALVVRSTKVTAATIEAAEALELIVRAGAGTNTIDVDAASEVGIYVTNVPGRNAIAVAELTMGLLLAIDRRIADNVADLRTGSWNKTAYSKADGLFGKVIGIVGLGEIGLAVADRAAAFRLQVRAIRKDRDDETEDRIRALGIELVDSLEDLVTTSDIVSIHVPATVETESMFDAGLLGRMREGAILLNTSRGDIVDEAALLDAVETGGIRAGLDVYPDEPGSGATGWSSRLAQHPNVVGTHHIGASTAQAQKAVADGVVEIIDAFVRGEILNCVNLAPTRLGNHTLHVRHFDRVGVLAGVFDILRRRDLNVEQMENRVFEGRNAAVATIDVVGDVGPDLIAAIEGLDDVIHVSAVPTERGGS